MTTEETDPFRDRWEKGRDAGESPGLQHEQVSRILGRLVETGHVGVVITDSAGNIEYANGELERQTGYSRAELIGRNICILKSGNTPDAVFAELWSTVSAGTQWRGRMQNRRRDGTTYWEDAVVMPVDAEGGRRVFAGLKVDISDQYATEEQLKIRSGEIEALLQEVYHRVRNNMQVISSLVNLQRAAVADPGAREVLLDIGARIHSIAVVHDLLYRSASFQQLRFEQFLSELTRHLLSHAGDRATPPRIKVNAHPVGLPVADAVPFGLLMNEILTTLIRTSDDDGVIHTSLSAHEGTVRFTARQDPARSGAPGSTDGITRLSLDIADVLAEQVGAQLSWCEGDGFEVYAELPAR